MADPDQELGDVCGEIEEVEEQIEALLEKQSRLLKKKSQLQQLVKDTATRNKALDWDKTDYPWSQQLDEKRSSVFGIHGYRQLQLRTMNATLSGKDCVLIMPTGGGKSLCFQLPALITKGITLVVSPLVSLMEDQVMAMDRINVKAVLLNASSTKEHVKYVQDNMVNKQSPFKMLYVTPEKLAKSKRFMARVEKMFEAGLFSRLVIDEVHCCSQWGHDFRPDYKFLGVMRRQFPGVPILGLTATATSQVLQDVKDILRIQSCLVFRASFNRTNLFYEVRVKPSGMKNSMDEICKLISNRFKGQSGIVYCLSQKDTEEVAKELQSRGIMAGCYHANLDSKYRSKIHTRWINDDIQVVVATIAFGMGIDKPDVRFVIHHSISKSMENYYQESGRAGRDDEKSHCILYVRFADISRQSTMVFTEQTGLEKLYGMVQYAYNLGKCRRTLIASHFGEKWDAAKCNGMCDQCNLRIGQGGHSSKEVSSLCRDIITIVENAKQKEQRITVLKLMESIQGRGAPILRVKTLSACKMGQMNIERVLVHMLIGGYLKEDFHFTAYTTISYILTGPKAYLLMSPDHRIEINIESSPTPSKPDKKLSATITSKPDKKISKPSSTITKSKIKSSDLRFVVDNTEQSAVDSKRSRSGPRLKKRKVVIDSDDELDFGAIADELPQHGCIMIDDSDDEMAQKETVLSPGGDVCNGTRISNGQNEITNGDKKLRLSLKSRSDSSLKAAPSPPSPSGVESDQSW